MLLPLVVILVTKSRASSPLALQYGLPCATVHPFKSYSFIDNRPWR